MVLMTTVVLFLLALSGAAVFHWFKSTPVEVRQQVKGGKIIATSLVVFFVSAVFSFIGLFVE